MESTKRYARLKDGSGPIYELVAWGTTMVIRDKNGNEKDLTPKEFSKKYEEFK